MKIYIIRHGQTQMNRAAALQGRSDQPLNEAGEAQAEEAGRYFKEAGVTFSRVYSSPLQRAVRTAEIIAGGSVPVLTDERLIEMDYGPYEGLDLTKLPPEILTFFSDFVHNPAPEGMEPLADVTARLGELLEELRQDPADGAVLLSTHAIAMKGALEYLTPESGGGYWSKYIGNCAVYVTELTEEGYLVPEVFREGSRADQK